VAEALAVALAAEEAAAAAAVRTLTTCLQTACPSTLQRQHQCSARQTRRQGSRSLLQRRTALRGQLGHL
jgi:hypothetical protein